MTATDPKATLKNLPMHFSQFNQEIYRCSYRASQFLHQHRTAIILGAFIFWTAMLARLGYFAEFGQGNTGFLIFGFLWLTIPMSLATYFIPRMLLHDVPLMNGYKPDEDK
jgi:hypothetical protein